MIKHLIAMSCLLLSPLAQSATYNLVDHGTYTRDLNSNLEWLDLSFTRGLSYNNLLGALNTNTNLAGWRLATVPEFSAIFTSRGYIFSGGPSSIANWNTPEQIRDPFFITLINLLSPTATTSSQALARGLLDEDSPNGFQIFGDISVHLSLDNSRASFGRVRDNDSGQILAAYLVREAATPPTPSAVPLPAAAWLMLSGLGVIGAVTRKRH